MQGENRQFLQEKAGWGYALLIILVFACYWPAIHGDFIWDDDNYVTANATLKSWQGLKDIWLKPGAVPQYYPLVHTTYWLEYRLWGFDPRGYHLINIVLHAISSITLWRLLKRLNSPWALAASVIFAIHPIHVESVAWITERKNVLSGLFYLLGMTCYLQFVSADQDTSLNTSKIRYYFLSFFLYLGALLSKTIACSFPVVVLLILWWKNLTINRKTILLLLPYFIGGLILAIVTIKIEKQVVGAVGQDWQFSPLERFLIASQNWWFYPYKLLWPETLTFFYPRGEIDPWNGRQYSYLLGFILVMVLCLVRQKHWGKTPLAILMIYTVMIFPALGFFNIYPMRYSFAADHFLYLASVPLIVGGVTFIAWIYRCGGFEEELVANVNTIIRPRILSLKHTISLIPIGTIVLILSFLTWERCHVFQSEEKLWLDTIAKNPTAWMAHNNLGLFYDHQGLTESAIRHYQQAVNLKPDHAGAYTNLAIAWEKLGNHEEVMKNYQQALSYKPNDARILNHLGSYLSRSGKWDKAIQVYQHALNLYPTASDIQINLGNTYATSGDITAAIAAYNRALTFNPGSAEAHYNLANAYHQSGDIKSAIIHCQEALKLNPNYAQAASKLQVLNSLTH